MKNIDLDNQTDLVLDIVNIENIALSLTRREVELIVTNNNSILELNSKYRNIHKPTDVLSFPIEYHFIGEALNSMPLGSIVVSVDFVKAKAKEFGHSSTDEFYLLFIHGLLHLLGYDHEVDNGEMREKERETIEHFGLPSSLIVRTEEF